MNKESAQILLVVLILLGLFGLGMYWLLKQSPASNVGVPQANNNVEQPVVTEPAPEQEEPTKQKNMSHLVTIKTNQGEIQFQTYDADAPKASKNFIDLAQKKFYDGVIFHRIIKGFMMQGGDPVCSVDKNQDKGRCGTGGPGYKFEDELNPETESYKNGYKKGVVAMANSGPDTNGSQFFIMLADYPLPNDYTIFGKVVKGQDVVDKIGLVKTDGSDRPVEAVVIQSVAVSDI